MHPFEERDFVFDLIKSRPGITTSQIEKARLETGIMEWDLSMILVKLTVPAKIGSRRNGLSVEWFPTGWSSDPDVRQDGTRHTGVPLGWSGSDIDKFWKEYPSYRIEGF